jgi:dual specificity phosphatase 12
VLSIAPAQIPSAITREYYHIDIPNYSKDELLIALPGACDFIREAVHTGGRVLVHSLKETRACIVVCAYRSSTTFSKHNHLHSSGETVMGGLGMSPNNAYLLLQQGT